MNRFQPKQIRAVSATRVVLGVVLLFACLSSVVPLASVSAGSMCRLACCVGKAPHAAGSCMGGFCLAALRKHAASTGDQAKRNQAAPQVKPDQAEPETDQEEHSCDHHAQPKPVVHRPEPAPPVPDQPQNKAMETTVSAATPLGMPCQFDCGSAVSANSNRQQDSATLADGVRLGAPTAIHSSNSDYRGAQIREALWRQGAPRGPPLFIS
jgi:hypothetical protein